MGKYSSAKCFGATDTKLQEAYNRLIDLLDSGTANETTVNGHRIRIVMSGSGGFTGYIDGVWMFGLDPVTGLFTIKKYEDLIISLGDLAYLDVVETTELGTTIFDGTQINENLINTEKVEMLAIAYAIALGG